MNSNFSTLIALAKGAGIMPHNKFFSSLLSFIRADIVVNFPLKAVDSINAA